MERGNVIARSISTKSFYDFPCSHRQPKHSGHCKYLHGYSREFHFKFVAEKLDERGWVWDFSECKWIKTHLDRMFDHTTLINEDDPQLATFEDLDAKGIIQLRVMPNVSMEGTAKELFFWVNYQLTLISGVEDKPRVRCFSVEVKENNKNSGMYEVSPYQVFENSTFEGNGIYEAV